MSDTGENQVMEVVTDEPSRVHRIKLPKPASPISERFWKGALLVLSTLGAAVVLAGGLGRLLYVTRAEYTETTRSDAVARENMRGTLERLDRTLNAQAAAFDRLTGEVQTVKVDLAVVSEKKR
jgi:hypothetical protein